MNFKSKPNSANSKEFGTTILYSCPEEKYYFDYPVGDNFTSFYNTLNINAISVTCNNNGYDFEEGSILALSNLTYLTNLASPALAGGSLILALPGPPW